MSAELFSIGPLTIYTHGFFLLIAALMSWIVLYFVAKKKGLDTNLVIDVVAYPLLAGLVGARITYFVLYQEQFNSLSQIFWIWDGGLVSWGGFIFALCTLYFVLKKDYLKWLDVFVIASLLGLAIGRFGSFLSGEYAGIPYDGLFSYANVHPITLYQAFWNLFVFVVLIIVLKNTSKYFDNGILALQGVIIYSLGRFSIDFLRAESDIIGFLSLGQLVSLFVFAISTIILIRITFRKE